MRRKFRPGVTFADFVIQDSSSRKSHIPDDRPVNYRRGWLVWVMIIAAFGVLAVRLASIQVFYGERFRVLSDQNRVKRIKLVAPRGRIVDRQGREVARNVTVSNWNEEVKLEMEGWRREYPFREAMAHVVGYLGEIGEGEVGLLKEAATKYDPKDLIGRSGIEAAYEEQLRGIDGGRLVEVDNTGQVVRELGNRSAVPGDELKLTADAQLSETALAALLNKSGQPQKGAVVASNPQTGEVFALVSSPSFDANIFTGEDRHGEVVRALTDTNLPLFNRAIGAVYPPGSTFKMITTAAAVMSGKVAPEFTYNDQGIITVGSFNYTNWLYTKGGGVEGVIGFPRAITRSTDTFFYRVGELTTPEVMSEWARKFGLGRKTGLDIPGETEGLVPDPDWKLAAIGERWFLGNTFHMAIGQGDTLTTPAQINLMTNILASQGKRCPLHLVEGANTLCDEVEISERVQEMIRKGMVGACSPGGTAFPLFDWNEAASAKKGRSAYARAPEGEVLPVVACKTGTAEYLADNGRMRTHGWLTAYAPADNPVISVTAVVEGGGEGSNVAAPIVRRILAKYFNVEDSYPYASIPQEVSE